MMKKLKMLFIVTVILCLCGCADKVHTTVADGHEYGFCGGLWHGLIMGFDFIGMLIWDDVAVYAPNNNGGWYAFGFVLGAGGFSWGVTRNRE